MAKRVQKPSSLERTAAPEADSEAAYERIARALERLAPAAPEKPRFTAADAFSWHPDARRLVPVEHVNRVEMSLLKGIDRMRDMMDNERSTAINPGEAVEEKVSLSDRFGLWLGFHRCSQDEFLAMVDGYVAHYRIAHAREKTHREALEWATTRGARSGRVAWQYVQDLAGRLGVKLEDKGR